MITYNDTWNCDPDSKTDLDPGSRVNGSRGYRPLLQTPIVLEYLTIHFHGLICESLLYIAVHTLGININYIVFDPQEPVAVLLC